MPQTTQKHFRAIAPAYMRLLLTDFPELGVGDTAAASAILCCSQIVGGTIIGLGFWAWISTGLNK